MHQRHPDHPGCVAERKVFGVGPVLFGPALLYAGHHDDGRDEAGQEGDGQETGHGEEPAAECRGHLRAGNQGQHRGRKRHDAERHGQRIGRMAPFFHAEHPPEIAEQQDGAEEGRRQGQQQPQLQQGIRLRGHEEGRGHQQVGQVAEDDRLPRRVIIIHMLAVRLAAMPPAYGGHEDAGSQVNGQRSAEKCFLQGKRHK